MTITAEPDLLVGGRRSTTSVLVDTWERNRPLIGHCMTMGPLVAMGVVSLVDSRAAGTAWLMFAGLVLPLLWRRRFPTRVFVATFALALGSWAAGNEAPYVLVVVFVAVFSVVRHAPPRVNWLAPAVVGLTFLVFWFLSDDAPRADLLWVLSWLGVSVLLATTLRARRAYVEQIEERSAHQRLQEARIAVARQRVRMAREVHDVVTHNVSVMTFLADAATMAPERSSELVAEIAVAGRRALGELQQLIDVLRNGDDDPQSGGAVTSPGTVARIDDLLQTVRAAGLRISYATTGADSLPAPVGLVVYRIVQEALTNALKHAAPDTAVEVRITCSGGMVHILVLDQGPSRSNGSRAAIHQGRGIAGMAARAAALGGALEAGPAPGGGWSVTARLPTHLAAVA